MKIKFSRMVNTITDWFLDTADFVKYDMLREPFELVEYPPIKTKLSFQITTDGVYAISQDVQGLIVTAPTLEDMPDALLDAWLTYYDVPRYQAKRVKEKVEIKLDKLVRSNFYYVLGG